ncbi:MAG: GNAT family N-acetyltransferase [Micavibrio aeruginosavorus]|uniref:GNAT family N-acetyltransferase n=1 Tax=Micavibrio aeruginosavorus TaxID=349221 RepID=A0A7T5R2V0_9BACT|nr:MAG: GNAT family N-acetyltransferase [Micavibrio aeruginosavorus]
MPFTIRSAAPDDAAALARIHIAGWRASYTGLVEKSFLDALDETQRTQDWVKWLSEGVEALLAHDGNGNPAGFVSFNRLMTPPPGMSPVRPLYTSEILAIYILPDYWRQGLGQQLMRAAAARLKEKKHKSLCLWVLERNARGNAFYKALGGQRCGKKNVIIGNQKLADVCYGWRDTSII